MKDRRDFLIQAGVWATVAALESPGAEPAKSTAFTPVKAPEWVHDITRMAFLTPGEVPRAAAAGAQVVHTNLIWPYFPLRREGGGLSPVDATKLKKLVADCRKFRLHCVLGLPPFPSVEHVRKHPDWVVRASPTDKPRDPVENDLGTRLGCNLGPWGDYLVELCGELIEDYGLDGFSFDGNYHPALCHCASCSRRYRAERDRAIPTRANLDDVPYREYLVWLGEKLEEHYTKLQRRIKTANPDAVLMSWTVNAGRYGHFHHSPRAMPTRLNRLFDLPMQEWWLDESNLGASVASAFGVAYLRAVSGDGPCGSEPYLMSRGRPMGTDSFPAHERLTRCMLALTHGSVLAESLGWSGHDPTPDFREVARRAPFLHRTSSLPWAAMLVSEQTRQFHAYRNITQRFLAPILGTFRAALEEHLPLTLVNDWDIDERLQRFSVVILPGAASLSDTQVTVLREYVRAGGGLVATGETSFCDELGRLRTDFALRDLFGVTVRGHSEGIATMNWREHQITEDQRLNELVPRRSVAFRGLMMQVSEPESAGDVVARIKPETGPATPAMIAREFGRGRVVYLATGIDGALWSYAYPYQRRLLSRAIEWAARVAPPVRVEAPMCVQAGYFTQRVNGKRRLIVHLFNGVNTTANHGDPATDVPLREEIVPIAGIRVIFRGDAPTSFRSEPGGGKVDLKRDDNVTIVSLPALEIHQILVGEY